MRKNERENGREKEEEAGGRLDSEEMEVSSKEEHMSDYLPRRKDIILLAPIVPHFAETLNLEKFSKHNSRGVHLPGAATPRVLRKIALYVITRSYVCIYLFMYHKPTHVAKICLEL